MNKKEIMLSLLEEGDELPYVPAGFFIHFDPKYHTGQAAIDKHLAYFTYTGMDFVKIQYETRFPTLPEITKPDKWQLMPCYGEEFYADQVGIAKGLVQAAGQDALVLMTLYSPFMCAGQTVGKSVIVEHLRENPDKTKKGIEIITESLMTFVKGCIEVGVDGFYHSTQGGEINRFEGSSIFTDCIQPYDFALMEEIERNCEFNILHVCDYEGGYSDLTPFVDYPGHVVNSNLQLEGRKVTSKEAAKQFGRPFMGGLDRHGIIASGSEEEIAAAVRDVCARAPRKFVLGADCTLPSEISWVNIKTAIESAHSWQR